MVEEKFREIFERSPIGIVFFDKEGNLTDANRSALKIGGVPSLNEVKGINLFDSVNISPNKLLEKEHLKIQSSVDFDKIKEQGFYTPTKSGVIYVDYTISVTDSGFLAQIQDITEQKKAEEKLKESKEHYRGVVQNTTAVILQINPQGIIQFANKRALEFFGYSADELVGKPTIGTIVPEQETTGRDLAVMVDEIIKNPESFHSNANENVRKNGERVWMEWTNSGIYDKYGNLKGFLSVGIDATEHKKTEEELIKAENRYRIVADFTYDWEEWLDNNGKLKYVSPSCERITGYSAQEFIDNPNLIFDIIHPDDLELFKKHLDADFSSSNVLSIQFRIISRDNKVRWIEHICQPVYGADGQFMGRRASNRDITDQKKAEDHFHKEVERESFLLELYKKAPKLADEELYRNALDLTVSLTDSTIGFFHMISDDQKNVIITAWNNEAWNTCKTSFKNHYPIEESGNWTDCIQTKRPLVYNDYENSPNRKGFPKGHTPVKRFISTPVFDEDKVKFIFGVGNKVEEYDDQDVIQIQSVANELYRIIKQRHSAQALKEAHDNLEEKVEQRTAEIEEAYQSLKENEMKLKDTVAELERSNQELQSFAYITSHDLQEPLRTIASYAQLIERRYKGQLDEDADDFLNFMVGAATRMKEMIQGLLNYSRIDQAGKEFVKTNMNVKLEKAIDNLQSTIEESKAEITHDDLPNVIADPNQMTMVFQNLISNAIKYKKPEIPPKIHIATRVNKNKREWVFSIKDNGIGMEMQYTDKIFEVFRRLHTIDEYEGTGIGLAIFKRIIERHGGRVWVESTFGIGSTFYFTIPIKNK